MTTARHTREPKHTAADAPTASRWSHRAPKVGSVAIAAMVGFAGLAGSANAAFQSSLTLNAPAGTSSTAKWTPSLGQNVSFTAVLPKATKNPVVIVTCFQNQTLVYEERELPTGTFLLGGTSSDWKTNGGAATCVANAYDMVYKAGQVNYMVLAVTQFSANG